ncbi:hypothetical protein [Clostridium sp. MD294]|uniref:hypothetical protein n=1 Tax=Clostridium sp. MD294 TaxID=97138 RepID=UPI0003A01F25|nr:hypothetical protein [Clostridium sp. MD294]NDO47155.1 hypothetical protein [Clostridium sp. MD294]
MKKLLPVSFIILFPYSIVLLIYSLFHTTLMKYLFHNNIYTGFFYICIFWLISFINAICIFIKNITHKRNALQLAKINMIIKLIQIPAYIVLFIVGIACMFTIFTFGISFVLLALDCASIFLSGLIGLSAVKQNYTEGIFSIKELFLHSILQFIFCADVISAIILFRKSKSVAISKNTL